MTLCAAMFCSILLVPYHLLIPSFLSFEIGMFTLYDCVLEACNLLSFIGAYNSSFSLRFSSDSALKFLNNAPVVKTWNLLKI